MEEKEKIIVTHNSGFHTDDIFAVATLLLVLGEEKCKIVRTRDMDVINKADYVVDVGGVHNEDLNRFDHHQEGGAGKRDNSVPYASFGLVWKKFGEHLCGSVEVANKIERMIVQPVDADDNGLSYIETKIPGLKSLDIRMVTGMFYPSWKEDILEIDNIFLSLVTPAKVFLSRAIKSCQDSHEAENLVREAYDKALDKRVIEIESSRYPWEEVFSKIPEVLYVVYKNINADTWSIKGTRDDLFSYKTRKKLPELWAGKMGEELEKITGVSGCVFCHNARFMAVNKTKEGIMKMADLALNS